MARVRWTWAVVAAALVVGSSRAQAQEPKPTDGTGPTAPTTPAPAPADFALKAGDRVVFYGDSITEQKLYTSFVESYVVTRFPGLDVRFVHSGWGGDRASGGSGGNLDLRLERDVLAHKPTVVTCMLGMNDASYRAFDEKIFETYSKGLEQLIEKVRAGAPDVRLWMIEPSPYDDVTRAPGLKDGVSYNGVLQRYGAFVRELAAREKTGVADLNSAVVSCLTGAKERDAKLAEKILPDRVHPGPAGHLVMARALLGAWHAPALVSSVEVDAAGKKVGAVENATVQDLKAEGTVSWQSLEGALPFAWDTKDPVVALAVASSDVEDALDRETLRVTGLTASTYTLKIDGAKVGTFRREKWEAGINLAALETPMHAQALAVHALTLEHNEVHALRWRSLQVPLAKETAPLPSLPRALEALDALEEDIVLAQRAKAKPVPHHFELIPQL